MQVGQRTRMQSFIKALPAIAERCAAAAHAAVPKPLAAALPLALLSRFSITYTGRRASRKNAESTLQWISVHFAQRNGWAPVQRKRRAASNTHALDCRCGLQTGWQADDQMNKSRIS